MTRTFYWVYYNSFGPCLETGLVVFYLSFMTKHTTWHKMIGKWLIRPYTLLLQGHVLKNWVFNIFVGSWVLHWVDEPSKKREKSRAKERREQKWLFSLLLSLSSHPTSLFLQNSFSGTFSLLILSWTWMREWIFLCIFIYLFKLLVLFLGWCLESRLELWCSRANGSHVQVPSQNPLCKVGFAEGSCCSLAFLLQCS